MEHITPLTIIVADDDQDDRELLQYLFKQNEKFILIGCFTSGIEVLDEIMRKKNIPDVLLVDMNMPFFTGIDLILKLEEMKIGMKMGKFIISTTINTDEQEKHFGNPYIQFLKKPTTLVEINDLPGVILESMNQHNNTKV